MDQATRTMIRKLEESSGKTLDQWAALVRKSGKTRHGEIVSMLKGDHGLTHGYANLVAHSALKSDASQADPDDLVAAQYSGAKRDLQPIYEKILTAVKKFGPDVEVAPKKGYVSLRRSRQFALVQPSTATRVDVGVQLKGVDPEGRLEKSGSFNAMVTHRVRIASASEVDRELITWLRRAYEQA